MSIGQDIDKEMSKIFAAQKRFNAIQERSIEQESRIVKVIWRACDALLAVAGKRWHWQVKQGLELDIAGYKISCNNDKDCKWLSIERLIDKKKVNFYPYRDPVENEDYDEKHYSFGDGDEDFLVEVFAHFPEIIHKMASAYAREVENQADMKEANIEVGLPVNNRESMV
jgi:hypothetical protein